MVVAKVVVAVAGRLCGGCVVMVMLATGARTSAWNCVRVVKV